MIAVFLSPLYILFNIYIVCWLLSWMGACHRLFRKKWIKGAVVIIYVFLASSILIAFLFPASPVQRLLKLISNYWLGTLLYIVMTVVIADLIRHVLLRVNFKYSRKVFSRRGFVAGGSLCLAVITAFTAAGIIGAARIQVTDYDIHINKPCADMASMKIVLAADLHLGYSIGCWHMEKMVEKINEQNPDLVVIAGDIFDNEYDALDDPVRLAQILSGIRSR